MEELSNGGSPVLKTGVRKDMWVRLPLPPPMLKIQKTKIDVEKELTTKIKIIDNRH